MKQEKTFSITYSPEGINKTSEASIGISKHPRYYEGTIDQIAADIISKGYPIVPCILKDYNQHKNSANWGSQSLFFIDIDCGETLEQAMNDDFFKSYALLIYTTYTHQKPHNCSKCKKNNVLHDKYRVVFALPEPLNHPSQARLLNRIFVRTFGHDKGCVSEIQHYFGNSESQVFYFDRRNILNFEALWVEYSANVGKRERQNDLLDVLTKNYGDNLTPKDIANKISFFWAGNGSTDAEGEDSLNITKNVYILNELSDLITNKFSLTFLLGGNPPKHNKEPWVRKIQNFKFDFVEENCLQIQNIDETSYSELLAIATNYSKLQRGIEEFERITISRPSRRAMKDKTYYHHLVKAAYSLPLYSCERNCRFYENGCAISPKNIFSLRPVKRGEARIIKKPVYNFENLAETRRKLSETIDATLKKSPNKIYGIKAETGVGKTFEIERAKLPAEYIIAASTYNILKTINRGFLYPEMPKELQLVLKPFYDIGLNPDMNDVEEYLEGVSNGAELITTYRMYKQSQKDALKYPELRLTHNRAILDKSFDSGRLNLFDEDPIDLILKSGKVEAEEFYKLCFDHLRNEPKFQHYFRFFNNLLSSPENMVYLTPKPNLYNLPSLAILLREVYLKRKSSIVNIGNILGLLTSHTFCKVDSEIDFMAKNQMPSGMNLIMSATLDTLAWEALYPNKFEFIEIGKTRPRANMIQIMENSFSKTSLLNNDKNERDYLLALNRIAKDRGFATITHKAIRNYDYKSFDGHFGALEGMRELEGKNLAIFGTPNYPDILLALKAVTLGIVRAPFPVAFYFGGKNRLQATSRTVRYDGMEFKYFTLHKDERLQKMQLDYTKRQIEQAMGRKRPLSTDGDLFLFSNFPMPGFKSGTNPFETSQGLSSAA